MIRKTLTTLFNRKAFALSVCLSLGGAMALPLLEQDQSDPSRERRVVTNTSPPYPEIKHPAIDRMKSGTVVIDGFKGADLTTFPKNYKSALGSDRTVIIATHGDGMGQWYNLNSDGDATAYVDIDDISAALTKLNPETIIVVACNPHKATPDDVMSLIKHDQKRLKTVVMIEPGTLFTSTQSIPFVSYDWVIGRTIAGNSSDRGFYHPLIAYKASRSNDEPAGYLHRFDRQQDGTWADRGVYQSDNLYDLIDITPLGWIVDAVKLGTRGPKTVLKEMQEINNPNNTLSYWDKVERNLEKPIATWVQVFNSLYKKVFADTKPEKSLTAEHSKPQMRYDR